MLVGGGSYLAAVKSTVLPEWLSMNGVVVVMVILRSHARGRTEVGDVRFWGVLSLAGLAGLVVAYPVNVWLVKNQLKHGAGGGARRLLRQAAITIRTTAPGA